MTFDDASAETGGIEELSAMPQGEQAPTAPPSTMPGAGGIPGLGGPGVDTPQEQEAVKNLMEAAKRFRIAAQSDPSIKPIIDTFLQDAFLKITEHYGFGEEGKMALKQAQLAQSKARASALTYGKGPTQGPPIGSGPPGPPPDMPMPESADLTY